MRSHGKEGTPECRAETQSVYAYRVQYRSQYFLTQARQIDAFKRIEPAGRNRDEYNLQCTDGGVSID